MKNKHYCLHAHFDFPVRADPWTEEAGSEGAARHPCSLRQALHLCYGPNSASPLLDEDGRILELVNNYARLSFDFSPELLAWIEREAPRVYARILEADRESLRETGHGNALAAPQPPLILPLATQAQRRACLGRGIADFRRRFGRPPEGLWLPESAVDGPSLEALIDGGIRFVLLSPAQAAAVRPVGSKEENDWAEVAPETLCTTRPYRWLSRDAAGRRHIDVFFYRRDLSPERLYERLPYALLCDEPAAAAREQVLDVGRRLANRLVDAFRADDSVELSHAASDGELYGLSRLHGNRALTYALDALEREAPARAANYGQFLELIPPPEEVRLHLPSSRSCPHGVGRWSGECGCRAGDAPGKPARWRAPLREALESGGRDLDLELERRGAALLRAPAEALADYASLALSGGAAELQTFLDRHSAKHLTPDEARSAVALCESSRWFLEALSHWTWSADDVSEAGPVYALSCVARAIDLARKGDPVTADEIEKAFIANLSKAPSHETPYESAAAVYSRLVRPFRVDMERALAHFAVADHFDRGPLAGAETLPCAGAFAADVTTLCRRARIIERRPWSLSVCLVSLRHRRTFERLRGAAAVLHAGGTQLQRWILAGPGAGRGAMETAAAVLDDAFLLKSPDAVRAAAERVFGPRFFSIDALLPAARRALISRLSAHGSPERRAYIARWRSFLGSLARDPGAADRALSRGSAASGALGAADRALSRGSAASGALGAAAADILLEARALGIRPDDLPGVGFVRDEALRRAEDFARDPRPLSLARLLELTSAAESTGLHLSLWELQALALQGLKRWIGPENEGERRRLARSLGLSDALFLWPAPTPGDRHGDTQAAA